VRARAGDLLLPSRASIAVPVRALSVPAAATPIPTIQAERVDARARLLRIIWPFVATVVLMLLLGDATLHMIRGARAYVSAGSLWSNAQKNAVGYLEQYAQTRNEDYFAQYQSAIGVTLGDRKARLALDHPRPDLARAREGLREGGNHPTTSRA
jgi:hypothetical protein